MLRPLKNALRAELLRRGIEVRKAPASFNALPVFPLVVEALMARRGKVLNFVQVGANDGVFGDPLRRFVLSCGWRGILVEPQLDVFNRLKANYAECADQLIFENIAVSRKNKLTLYLPPEDTTGQQETYGKSVVSSDADVLARQIKVERHKLRQIDVPAMTLDALLAKHDITELDLLQIDAEGYDWEVLQTLDLNKVAPLVIQMETGHLHRNTISTAARFLSDAGYLIYYGGWQGDTVAMRRDVMEMPHP